LIEGKEQHEISDYQFFPKPFPIKEILCVCAKAIHIFFSKIIFLKTAGYDDDDKLKSDISQE